MKTFNDLLGAGSRLEPENVTGRLLYAYTRDEDNVKSMTHLTNAMIRGGLLSLVWKNRLLLILCGDTSAANVCHITNVVNSYDHLRRHRYVLVRLCSKVS